MKLNKNIQYFLLTLILLTVIISISSVSATSVSNITTNDNSMFSSNDNSSLITTDNTINNKNTTTKQDTNQNVNTSKTDYSKITNITTNSNSVQSNLKTDANNQNSILNTTNTSSGNSQEIKTTQKTAYTNNIIYVSPTGNGNGETINTPTNIQNAIKNIAVSGTWTILLSNGTYSFTSQLEIKCNNLTITGSATNVPIFNGNGKSRMFYMANTNNIVNRILYLNNIKFINGQGSDLGGAIYINYGSLEVTNCKFINNYAGSAGGAITFYAHNSTSTSSNYLRIKDSEFTNNTAKNYAGAVRMYCIDENKMSGSNAYFINCLFQNNIAKGINSNGPRGGALNFHNIKGIITDCQFINNAAGEAGGAIRTDSTLTITNTLFDGNKIYGTNGGSKADYAGSAIYNNNGLGVGAEKAIITLIDCIFQNHDSNFKGTIYNSPNAYITIYNGIFRNNTAKSGGLIYSEGTMDLHGCKIYNNTAEYGGAIYNTGDISVFDNQIIDNKATNGAVIYNINACNLTDSKILNNYVTFNNGSVIYNTGSMNIVNNYFENNTDNTRDMLIGSTKSIGVRGNIYVGNYLEDSMTKVNDTSLSVKDVSFKYYETLQLKSIYNDTIRNGAITVYINGQAYKSFNVKDGSTNIEIPVTELDSTNTVLYSYASTDKSYQVTSTSFKITVYKIETKLNTVINNDTVDSNSISVTVKGIDNVLVPDGMVSIYEGFNLVGSATITNGVATFKLNLAAGKHTLTVNYTKGTRYANSHGDLTITIIKIPTYLNTVVTSSTVDNSSIQVKVIDIYGRNITSGTIIVYENNNTIGTGTVSNGISNIKLDIIAGEHNLDIKYFETNVYLSSNGTIPITVSKIGTITTATIVKESIEESSILVNVIDTNNKLVPDGTVNVYEGTNLVGQGTIVSGSVTIKLNIGIGSHKLNVRYLTNDKYLQSSYDITVTPGKISTNIFTTITNDKIKNSTIKVTVKDINNNLIPNGTVNVYEGTNLVGQGTVTSGVTNIKLNLTAGIHTITVRYEGTDTYGVATGTMNMTIYKISTGTTATITSNIPYNSGIKVIIIDQYGNNVPTGLINVTENGVFIASGTVNNGVSNIALNLLTGKHTLNIKYMENDIYLVSSTGLDLTVNKIDTSLSTTITNDFVSTSSIKVTVKDINNKTITSGVINVFENNNYIGSATITGTESNILLNLTAGTHTITVRYEGDNTYNKAEGSLPITVYKIGTKLASNIISNIVDNSSIKVTVTDTQNNLVTEGIVNIYKGTTIIGQGTIINGVTIISLNLTAGTHTINIKYMGTEKYLTSSFQTNITINKIDVNLNTVITHDTVGNSTIRVTVTDAYNNKVTNGTIIVYENGKQVGKATLTQTSYVDIDLNLTSGTHNLNINYGGTNKYNKNTVNLTLNLNKKDTGLTTSITNNIVGNSSIKVTVTEISNKKAVTSGTVIVYENNIQIGIGTVSSNGIANIKLSLTNGTHTITINYNGTSIYSKTTGSLNITIYKINTMITSVITNNIIDTSAIQVNITDIYGQKVKSGTVEIYEGTVLVGQASVSTGTVNIPLDLTVGKHTIKICYTGTNIYATSSSTGTVTINKIDTSLNTIITDDSIDNPTIRVTVIDANNDKINVGNVLVYEKGILIGVQKVVDSSAYVKLNILSGIHNITVVYEGTNKYATSNGTTTITINKLNTQLSKELTNNQVGNSTIKVTVIDNNKELVTNGTVSIYENNKLIGQGVISGGIVNIPLDLTAGNHNIKINYEGTTRYNVCNLTSTITINKVNTQLNTIITHDVVGNSSIQVHVTDSNNNSVINGIVNVYEGTTLIGQSNIENGICDINLKLTGGNHTIKVKYEGTTKYIGSEGTLTINLNKKDTTMSTVILNNTVDNSIIKVTVKDINNNLVPDGTVFIYEGTTLIGFNTITNGVTNIKLNILSGTHNITVNYNGTNTYSKTTRTISIT
ncbi:MAG: hypothetical protein Q4Q23_02520, partial [Methanobacteriaceae archaeon]|nr:hypothetical protein [Methanobacteriaceae archaeon]